MSDSMKLGVVGLWHCQEDQNHFVFLSFPHPFIVWVFPFLAFFLFLFFSFLCSSCVSGVFGLLLSILGFLKWPVSWLSLPIAASQSRVQKLSMVVYV